MDVVLGRFDCRLGGLPLALLLRFEFNRGVARRHLLYLRLHRAVAAAHSAPLPVRTLGLRSLQTNIQNGTSASRTSKLNSKRSVSEESSLRWSFPHLARAGFLAAGGPRGRRLALPDIVIAPGARPRRVGHRRPLRGHAATPGPRGDPGHPEEAAAAAAERFEEPGVQRGEVERRGG
uniref:Uncharacterized protein n=1 Tax=Zea mays TaxID=4577 RepID=C4J086_MAIZE|nr:unknown [Zea mays]